MSRSETRHSKSVYIKFTVFFAISLAVMLVVFSAVIYLLAGVRTESVRIETMNSSSGIITGFIRDYMTPKIDSVTVLAKDHRISDFLVFSAGNKTEAEFKKNENYDNMIGLLSALGTDNHDVVSTWIISENDKVLVSGGGVFSDENELRLGELYWHNDISLRGLKGRCYCTAVEKSLVVPEKEVISIICPVISQENIIGYVGMEIDSEGISKILERYALSSSCYPIITCNYGSIVYSPKSEEFRSNFDIDSAPLLNILVQASSFEDGIDSFSDGEGFNSKVYYYVDKTVVPNWNVIILFDMYTKDGGIYVFCLGVIAVLACLLSLVLVFVNSKIKRELSLLPQITRSVDDIYSDNGKTHIDTSDAAANELLETAQKLNKIGEEMASKNELIQSYSENDTITGIPNRTMLYKYIDSIIKRNKSDESVSNGRFAIMFVDLDNFKWMNENLGHNFGDEVLRTFASMLSSALSKTGRVFRFSGDEFIVVVEFGEDYQKIYRVIDHMQTAFSKQIKVMSDNIYIKFSVGVSIYPDDDDSVDMLLRAADLALHKAKENGKDRVSFYTNAAKLQNYSKAAISHQVSEAIRNGELYLNYQPIISSTTYDIHGFEVLVRWDSPIFGNIPTQEFINVAEETGDIVQIGMWVFENACRFLRYLCDNYRDDIIMSINVSPVQLKRADFIESIRHVIDITQLNTRNIQIEITESTLIDFLDNDNSVINELNEMGIALALDDFGTGYSSLNYLKNLPIKCLKIDKSFVDEINNNKRDQAITDSIIDLVHSLGIKTVAEGIETVGQYNFLREIKCDYIQGFLMSKPLNEEDAMEFVEHYDDLHKPDEHIMKEHEKELAAERDIKQKQKELEDQQNQGDPELIDSTISK